jgi:hypothetical protein
MTRKLIEDEDEETGGIKDENIYSFRILFER